jgi:hypothetical protein
VGSRAGVLSDQGSPFVVVGGLSRCGWSRFGWQGQCAVGCGGCPESC